MRDDGARDQAAAENSTAKSMSSASREPLRDRVRTLLRNPVFALPDEPLDKEAYRELVFRWTAHLADPLLGGEDDRGS